MTAVPKIIYALKDPDTGEVRYIGKQSGSQSRYVQHMKPSAYTKRKGHVYAWIRSLVRHGLKPVFVTLYESSNGHDLNDAEVLFIEWFRGTANRLCNHTGGGEGCIGYKPTLETREKLRLAIVGKRVGPKHPLFGKKMSDETRAKIRESRSGKGPSPSHLKMIQKRRKRPVLRSDGRVFESATAAARVMGVTQGSVCDTLHGRSKTCKGFEFQFLQENQ
jgi:hypothetical protein